MMPVAAEECDDVEVEEGGLKDGDHDGGEAEEAVVEDLLLAEHGVRGFVRLALGGAGGTHVYLLLETPLLVLLDHCIRKPITFFEF